MNQNKMSYSIAIKRLEEIVRLIDGNQLEIDELSEKIKEANQLIDFCKQKLTKADEEVEKLLSERENTKQ